MSSSVSIFDVAKVAGVSICTVSHAINGRTNGIRIRRETRQRVLAMARQLGYQPDPIARDVALGKGAPVRRATPPAGLSDSRSQTAEAETKRRKIGVILSSTSSPETIGHIPNVIQSLAGTDCQLVISTIPTDPTTVRDRTNQLLRDGMSGMLCCSTVYPTVSATVAGQCPVIVLWAGAGAWAGELLSGK